VWQGAQGLWAPCVIEHDGTGGFNRSGEVILRAPAMAEGEFQRMQGYWLRCYLTDAQAGANAYRVSPDLERVRVEARGGTTSVRHAITVRDEYLGKSDGTPGQSFTLLNRPLLARNPNDDYLIIETPDGPEHQWTEVGDFSDSGAEDNHFTLDSQNGLLTFGPSLVQPDGSVYRFGTVPPRGSGLRFHRYQFGGGTIGNVPAHTLSVLKSSIPYVARVTNWASALGGQDGETLEHAKIRAPQLLRSRTRAVTADDYEYLACQVPGIARACCIAPGALPGGPDDPKPGQVVVVVLPEADHTEGHIAPVNLNLSAESRGAVISYLNERRMLGTALDVRQPTYLWISVQTSLHIAARSEPALIEAVQRQAEAALYGFLNPYIGGVSGDGWPFGRDLHPSEISALLQ
ncbi:MAG: putative baseplate assembly protein, partial [Thermomicrobia bacterium]|nr:putative baseplate assembly protein [Thermomicrobia bacterium]